MFIHDGDLYDLPHKPCTGWMQINSCGVGQSAGNRMLTLRKNGRLDYHLVYVQTGAVTVRHGDTETHLESGGFFLYFPQEAQWYFAESGTQTLWIHFDGTAVLEVLRAAGVSSGAHQAPPSLRTEELFIDIMTENQLACDSYRSGASGYLVALLHHLGNIVNGHGRMPDARLRVCLAHLSTHYTENTSCNDLARMAHMSRSRFLHLFREGVGVSPLAYRTALRMQNAKFLLLSSDLSVAEIGRTVGYDDALYFSRVFRKEIGKSPESYRKGSK